MFLTSSCRAQSTLEFRTHFVTSNLRRQILSTTSVAFSRVQTSIMIKTRPTQHTRFTCKAGLEDDAPYAIAIGACVLSTLVIPILKDSRNDANSENIMTFNPDDIRYAAMGIISFIPLFNWMAWIFAWLDTNEQQYMIYAIVYLAPYLKTGLSLSPEDSWLPLASVIACIVHVQLEIAVKSEGMQDMQLQAGLSKVLLEKTKLKELRERADGLLNRLRHLAENPVSSDRFILPSTNSIIFHKQDVSKAKNQKVDQLNGEDTPEKEFQAWDEQLLSSNQRDERSREAKSFEEER